MFVYYTGAIAISAIGTYCIMWVVNKLENTGRK